MLPDCTVCATHVLQWGKLEPHSIGVTLEKSNSPLSVKSHRMASEAILWKFSWLHKEVYVN